MPSWTRDNFYIAADSALIDLDALGRALASPLISWANDIPMDQKKSMVENSLCFGVFHFPAGVPAVVTPDTPREMVGFCRLITDKTTWAYLSDVYILEAYQGRGLAKWLCQCVDEVTRGFPALRSLVLFTASDGVCGLYKRELGVKSLKETMPYLHLMSRNGPGYTLPQAE